MKRAPRRSWVRNAVRLARGAYGAYRLGKNVNKRLRLGFRQKFGRGGSRTVSKRRAPQWAVRKGTGCFESFSGWKTKAKLNVKIGKQNSAFRSYTISGMMNMTSATAGVQLMTEAAGTTPLLINLFTPYDILNFNGVTAPTSKIGKMLLQSGRICLMATNNSNGHVFIDLYTIKAKRDTTQSTNPYTRWRDGIVNLGGASADLERPGMKPTHSTLFNNYYNILKVSKHCLAPGQILRHNFAVTPNRLINTELLWGDGNDTPAGNYNDVKGLTTWIMPVVYGAPAPSDFDAEVSTGGFKVDFVYTKLYRSRVLEQNDNQFAFVNGLTRFTKATEDIMNEDGVVINYAEAG